MRPNWFLAFPLAGHFVLDLPELPPGFRRYHPDDVHMTLAFLGGCGEEAAQRALEALDARLLAVHPRPMHVKLGEVVPMGPKRKYSALSALLAEGRAETEATIGALRDAPAIAAKGQAELRAPKAHVTIARPFRAKESERAAGLAWARRLDLHAIGATLDRIALYTWSEDRKERLFKRVAERTLG
jgi:RNA 2',3'-cyclic 3'-phosphodiesterase